MNFSYAVKTPFKGIKGKEMILNTAAIAYTTLNLSISSGESCWYMYGIKKIRPLNYIDYDPTKALDILKEKIGYLDYGSKHCESSFTRLLQCYIQPKKYGFEKRRAHLSSLIVSGKLNRNEALKILSEQPCSELQLESDINEFIRKIDISKEKFNEIINDKNYHSHYDFKTNEVKNNIFKKIRKILGKR